MTTDRLLIKLAVGGKMLLDTAAEEVPYSFRHAGDGGEWRLEVDTPFKDWVHLLLLWKSELNVFLFPAAAPGEPVRKLWFYVAEASYDKEQRKLVLQGHSYIEYVPSAFGFIS